MNLNNLNLVGKDVAVKPNYVPKIENRVVRFFFFQDTRLIILGEADNNYCYWFSITELTDEKLNNDIIKKVLCMKYEVLSQTYLVAKKACTSYEEMEYLYSGKIEEEQSDYGKYLTKLFVNEKQRANSIDNRTKGLLQEYLLHSLRSSGDPVTDFKNFLPVIKWVKDMKYVILSDDEVNRLMYAELKKSCKEIYNKYMTVVR